MRILEQGRPQTGWSTEERCTGRGKGGGGCGALLLVEAADLFLTESHCLSETDTYVTFRCEGCGVLTDLESPPAAAWRSARTNGRRGPDGLPRDRGER